MTLPAPVRTTRTAAALGSVLIGMLFGGATVAQSPGSPGPAASMAPPGTTVGLLTHGSFALSQSVLDSFALQTGASIHEFPADDAVAAIDQAVLTKSSPFADVLYGVDDTLLSRGLDAGIFEAYQPAAINGVPEALRLDPQGRVTPIDYGDVCVNTDLPAFTTLGIDPPSRLTDLTDPRYKGMLVVEDPGKSSPGLAFLMATIDRFGETGDYTWQDYWADLRTNEVRIADSWEEAYYTDFSGGSGQGERPLVVSYATSPVAEVVFDESKPQVATTGVLLDGCYRQVEFAGVLAGTDKPGLARRLVDFLLSQPVQEDIPLNMFVFPALERAVLPEVFRTFAQVPEDAVTMSPEVIAANRDRWIEEWTHPAP